MMLELRNVDAYYGESQALHDVTLTVPSGSCTVLLGRNGAGKTTTLRTIIGELAARSGEIQWDGQNITGLASHQRSKRGLAYVASDSSIFAKLTVMQNLALAAGAHPAGDWNRDRVFEFFPKLKQLINRRAGVLSGGERQMLKLGMALLTQPKLILLDEPTQGVAPVVVDQMREWLTDLLQGGLAILLSEQNALFASRLGTDAYIIEKGGIVAHGSIAEMTDPIILDKYLGV
ncbi:ABC transporter ATP-binding protein [Tessaracoccus sp. MC1865]|uniref:ABC transporter ATP-binding protein n=1 Tax=Tessaracoccus sp. MC1865 TaxID=2760310 RepID=UPI00160438FB|nr:ABC transporter ATP-binding protein [Tessaracoccus sp. MC1865]MBB1482609.1 ABC transporter ATP-binding protein [Tessaracoccus sp. MC1865]QTO37939.1 ABC transporter ATP-binding protein [Tessaracoccus sp. MC1865]